MTKQETIDETYIDLVGKEFYETIKSEVDQNGSVDSKHLAGHSSGIAFYLISSDDNTTNPPTVIRPLSLLNIENNNGWTKIKNQKDIPADYIQGTRYLIGKLSDDGRWGQGSQSVTSDHVKNSFRLGVITHFRKENPIPKPIF